MHVAIICPFSQGPTRGNLTTVNRIYSNLQKRGYRTSLIPLDAADLKHRLRLLGDDPPNLLHAFHAYHSGPLARELATGLKRPYLITLTGSDIFDPTLRDHEQTRAAICGASAVTCFDHLIAEHAVSAFTISPHRIKVIPQAVEPLPVNDQTSRPENAFVILLPAALRPVKGIDDAITQLHPLSSDYPQLQLWIAGGILDQQYAELIAGMAARKDWIQLLGEIPYQQMGGYYQMADLVLNSSWFEGGMANAMLEAMILARPVLARDVPGNRSLIHDGTTGWLYSSGQELRDRLVQIIKKPAQRKEVGRAAQEFVQLTFSPQRESSALRELYETIMRQH